MPDSGMRHTFCDMMMGVVKVLLHDQIEEVTPP
ncbi:hypothetical protein J2X61_005119 [Bacillus sp. 3255]|nr:hypothetical protein [Bacillus sp. 3255]